MPPWLGQEYLGNPLWLWGAAVLVALVSAGAMMIARRLLATRLGSWASESKSPLVRTVASTLGRTRLLFLLAMALFAGSLLLDLGTRTPIFRRIVVFIAIVQGGFWATALLLQLLAHWRSRKVETAPAATVILATGFLGQILIWSTVFLLSLDNFGVKVTALLAGLGVGGVAVALAVQNVLGDLFASISILLDRPFEIGDFIIVGDMMGSVEHIGLKTTRLRSLTGEQIICSNADLLDSRIRNYKRMLERRVSFTLNVAYATPSDRAAAIPGLIRAIIDGREKVRFDRAHLQKLGDFALVYEVVYFVTDPDHTLFMNIQQEINLALLKRFEEESLRFAFPTQSVHVETLPGPRESLPARFPSQLRPPA